MCMREPNAFVCKLCSVDALGLRSVIVDDNFTALHHEARDNPLKHSILIVQVHP